MSQQRQGWQEKYKLDEKWPEKREEKGRMKFLTVLNMRNTQYIICIEKKKETSKDFSISTKGQELSCVSRPSSSTSGTAIFHCDSEEKQHLLLNCPLTLSSSQFILDVLPTRGGFV